MTKADWTHKMVCFRHIALAAGLAALCLPQTVLAQPMMGGFPGMGSSGPTEVGVVTVARQSVPYTATLPGRVTASKIAEIRPQVSGIIKSVDFREGFEVEAGDLLYEIESDSYAASLASAKASLQRANVTAASAEATVERYKKILNSGISQADLDDANLAVLQAKADVASAEAAVTTAQINLNLTRISAPLSGAIGLSSVNQGALVTANQSSALVTIRQLDPVYIDLVDSSANLLKLRKVLEEGTVSANGNLEARVTLTLEDGSTYDQTGVISQAEANVSQTTGTFNVRATISNPDRLLLPGMFVRATVELGDETAFLVPQRAVTFDADGKATVLVVSAEGKAETRVLSASRSYGNSWVVTDGLEEGDQLIVDGFQKISDGSEVTPLPVEIDDDGVVLQTITAGAAPPDASGGGMPSGAVPSGTMPAGGAPTGDQSEGSAQ